MLSPGSKSWIEKYLNLLQEGEIEMNISLPKDIPVDEYLHFALGNTGLLFGVPSKLLFAKNVGEETWTESERLKVVYFESLLMVFKLKYIDKDDYFPEFIEKLNLFYESGGNSQTTNWLKHLFGASGNAKLEEIINERIKIRKKIENNLWVNYLNNSLVFLDVILFRLYLDDESSSIAEKQKEMAINAMQMITYAVHEDNRIEQKGQAIFDIFLASSDLEEKDRDEVAKQFKTGISIKEIHLGNYLKGLFKRYLLDLAMITVWAETEENEWDKKFIKKISTHLGISQEEQNECMTLVETFILQNHQTIPFLNSKKSYEKVFSSFSKRWIKILDRNKDKLATELRESKELVILIKKSATTELTAEEKEKVKTQFLDVIKSMPALAIFMLPGGALLLPIVLKIIPDLIPSAFRENEIENEK